MESIVSSVEYAETKRKEIMCWDRKYRSKGEEILQKVDAYIEQGTAESYKALCEMAEDDESLSADEVLGKGKIPVKIYKEVNDFSYLFEAINIYYMELSANVKCPIFAHGKCFRDIIDVMNRVRFLLWEVDYLTGEDTSLSYVYENEISPQMLAYLTTTVCFSPYDTLICMAKIFEKAKKLVYEFRMLLFAIDQNREGIEALQMLEALCEVVGNAELAAESKKRLESIRGEEPATRGNTRNCEVDRREEKHAGKKVAFILCVNDALYAQEALRYINNLVVPEGCEIEVFTIEQAHSMTSGYNEGMQASNAKYKVYLHQDVFILNKYFLYDILDIFENPKVGMIGMVGAPRLSENKVMWYSSRIGKIHSAMAYSIHSNVFANPSESYQNVEVIDGLLMATQYDIPWREELFDKWDMYDVSQSLEFHKAGYDVVVPAMEEPWCLHDDGFMNLTNYYGELEKLKKEYYYEYFIH